MCCMNEVPTAGAQTSHMTSRRLTVAVGDGWQTIRSVKGSDLEVVQMGTIVTA